MITAEQLLLLLPMILVSATAVITMLMIAVRRSHAISCLLTSAGLLLALLSLFIVGHLPSQEVTPLLDIDAYGTLFSSLILLTAISISLFCYPYLKSLQDHQDEFYLLLSIATLGALLMTGSRHFISAFLGMEILGISLYGMVAYPLHQKGTIKHPLEASIKYLVLSAVSSGFVLFGMALLYAQTGTLSFTDISLGLMSAGTPGSAYYTVAVLLILSGFAFKLSLVPFHLWTPDVYEGAPMPATAFLASIGKIAMFALLLRFINLSGAINNASLMTVLGIMAAASMLIGNLLALRQQNLKRLLAYSSIAHMGYLLFAMITVASIPGTESVSLGNEAVVFYLLAYTVMTIGTFGVLILLSDSQAEADRLAHYQGLFWRDPWLATVLAAMLLSLAGIPLTIGFIGKFYVFIAGVEGSQWELLAAMVIGSGIGLYYYLRIIYSMLLSDAGEAPVGLLTEARHLLPHCLLFLTLVALVAIGILPAGMMDWVRSAVMAL